MLGAFTVTLLKVPYYKNNLIFVLLYIFVLLNLLNTLRKRDKMPGKPSILSLFLNSLKSQNYMSPNVNPLMFFFVFC